MLGKLRSLAKRLAPGGGTSERAIKSSLWLIGQNVLGRGLQLAMLVVLARFISPGKLGLIGIALLALAGLDEFTTAGTREALVQHESADVDDYLNTTWVIQSARGLLIGIVLFASAPLVGEFFGEAGATPIVRAIALSPILMGLKNPAVIYFQKDLEYHKQFVFQSSGAVAQFVVAVGYVLVVPSVWAYVVAYLVGDVVRLTTSYLIHDYRPSFQFDRAIATEVIGYGKWITGSSILYFLSTQGDDAFVGWLLGPAMLAFYQYAYRFSNAPATELMQVVADVMFPVYSQLQGDVGRLENAFFRSLRATSFLAFPMAAGIAVVAPSFVRTFLGSEWTPMIPAMRILAAYGLLGAIGKTCSPVWKALGRPDFGTKIAVVNVALIAAFIYPATEAYGIAGTALAVLGARSSLMFVDFYFVAKFIESSVTQIVTEVVYPFAAATAMGTGIWWVSQALAAAPPVEFAVLVLTGVTLYAAAAFLVDWQLGWGIGVEIRAVVAGIRE